MTKPPDKIDDAIHKGQRGDFTKARTLSRDLGRIPPSHPGLLVLANLALNGGLAELALRFIGRAVLSGHADAHYGHGVILLALERRAEALEAFKRCLDQAPAHVGALVNSGAIHQLNCEPEAAEAAYLRARLADPEDPVAQDNLAGLYLGRGRFAEAEPLARQAVARHPSPGFHLRLADILCADGRYGDGLAVLRQGLARSPSSALLWRALGHAQKEHGSTVDALAAFRKALAIDPRDGESRHMIDSLNGAAPPRPSADYIRDFFDGYAERFEDHLVNRVNYTAPRRLRRMFDEAAGGARLGTVADLGCGTGLTAEAFSDAADEFIGIDLSPRMLQMAARRGLYRQLLQGEIAEVLAGLSGLSAIIATDVFIYIGDLGPAFAASAAALVPGGWLLFSVETNDGEGETNDGEGWTLLPTGRYAQSPAYIESLAMDHGLEVMSCRREPIRGSREGDITGDYWILRRN